MKMPLGDGKEQHCKHSQTKALPSRRANARPAAMSIEPLQPESTELSVFQEHFSRLAHFRFGRLPDGKKLLLLVSPLAGRGPWLRAKQGWNIMMGFAFSPSLWRAN
jgi:hypothetical protein